MTDKPKNPLTKEGFLRLSKEYELLQRVERPKVVEAVKEAAAHGDRSENAEYIYGKKRLREIDKRLHYLSQLLGNARVVEAGDLTGDKVCFGATVVVADESGTKRFTIVGEGEVEGEGKVSYTSPMARALIGKRVGDVVEVKRPKDMVEVEIIELYFGKRLIGKLPL